MKVKVKFSEIIENELRLTLNLQLNLRLFLVFFSFDTPSIYSVYSLMSAKCNNYTFNFGGDTEQKTKGNVLKKLKMN
jgi:hypothetical protein